MKHLILTLSLTLGLLVVGATTAVVAQESGSQQESVETTSEDNKNSIKIGNGNVKFAFDTEDSNQKKLEKVAKLVGKVLSKDVGEELSVELKTLSDNEKEELVEVIESGFSFDNNHSGGLSDNIVPLLAVLLIFGFPIVLVMVLARSGQKKRIQKMELVSMYLQADKELPRHVINAFEKGGADSSLRSGLVLIAVGLGLIVGFNISGDSDAAAFGFIPLFIGIARLAFWYFEERKYTESSELKDLK